MAIKFTCSCGKHLRAPVEHAGRRVRCPGCGSPVGVPNANYSRPQAPAAISSAPATEQELPLATDEPAAAKDKEDIGPIYFRLRPRSHGDPNRVGDSLWVPLEGPLLPPPEVKRRKRWKRSRVQWRRENNWFDCLIYPFRAWPLVLGLGTGLGIFVAVLTWLYLQSAEIFTSMLAAWALAGLVVGAGALAYTIAIFDCALASAIAGEFAQVRWPGWDVVLALRSCLTWLLCFLAGPALFVGVAFFYWFFGGDPDWLDTIILAELAIMATGTWFLAVAAAAESGQMMVGPEQIVDVFLRLGWGAKIALFVAPGPIILLGQFVVFGVEKLHASPVGVFLLMCAGVSGVFLGTFLMRYLGMSVYKSRPPETEPGKSWPAIVHI